ncbi:MAG TPA: helix-turn-helix domain-containing protein, partial [Ktedonobacteraceae bacterium]|nr:helix-turn-helix domain-containing protein [Ktedonobacteraceae bacterium]
MRETGNDHSSFGALLKALRKRKRLTQQQLAEAIGMHRNAIIRWERGDFLPESKTLVLELARQLCLGDQETRQLLEASLTALTPYWLVPLPRNQFFTGREEILEALHTQLGVEQAAALTQSSALHGLGGVGKTQIALEYAYRYALQYSAVFWIGAETEEQIVSSLLCIAEVLQLPERENKDQQRVLTAVQRWLSTHGQWLLIWDNMEELALLDRFLPPARSGAILITTRCQTLGTFARGLDLLPMEHEEGMLFLLRRAKVLKPEASEEQMQQLVMPEEYSAARQIVTIMGGLPLALDQTGAYIEETGCGLAGYLLRYKLQPLHLLDRRGVGRGDHPYSVVATLQLACQRVAQQHLPALDLLRFCAFLHPDAIPEEILASTVSHGAPVPGPMLATAFQLDSALATLRRFSLVQRHPETRMLSLHRLVQVILQEEMSEQERAEFQQRVVRQLNETFPKITVRTSVETWEPCERLLPHVMICAATIPDCRQDQELAEVLLKAADYLHERSQYERAESLYQRALQIQEQTSG